MLLRTLAIVAITLISLTADAAEPWQQWRVEASNHPQRWLATTENWIENYDQNRQYKELAMAYAIRAEALRYIGDESNVQSAIKEGLRFAEIAEYPAAAALLRINETWFYLQRGRFSSAATSAVYAVETAKASQNNNLLIESEIVQAQVFYQSGDIARALEILESLNAEQYSDLPRLQMEFHALIGAIYLEVGAYDIAIEHMQDARDISTQHLGDWDTSVMEYNIGRAHFLKQEFAIARAQFNRALAISRDIDDKLGIAYALYRLAEIEQINGDMTSAMDLMQQALPVFRDAGAHPMEAQTRLGISQLQLKAEQWDSAKSSLLAAESLINTLNDTKLKQELYSYWSEYYQAQQNYQQALAAYKRSVDHLLENQRVAQDKQVQEIMVRLEIREQEATNELLQKENELQQLQLQEQQTSNYLMLWLLLSGAAIVMLILYFLYQQMRARKQYAELALKDDLTGAPNRRAIVRFCKQGLNQVKHNDRQLGLAIIDFDYFKQINDQFGHDVGDRVLKRFAEVTEHCLRSNDHFGRMGGEEWLLVFFDTNEQDAELIFKRLLHGINENPIEGLPKDFRITFSMGFAAAHNDDNFEQLYKRADDVLYQAKHQGRERLEVAPAP